MASDVRGAPGHSTAYATSRDDYPDAPPRYEDIQPSAEEPPSYESLYGRVQTAKRQSTTHLQFFFKFVTLLWGTVGCTIIVGIFIAVPVSMIVIGAIYFHDCPLQHYIPKYLIIGGCFGMVKNVLVLLDQTQCWKERTDESETPPRNRKKNFIMWLLNIFLVLWLITGCVWLFPTIHDGSRSHDPDDSEASYYCQRILYHFALWGTVSAMIVMCGAGIVTLGLSYGKKNTTHRPTAADIRMLHAYHPHTAATATTAAIIML